MNPRSIGGRSYRGALLLALCVATPAWATPSIKVQQEVAYDGPIKYTVKMASKSYGNAEETRTIRSGQTDDFTWQTDAPGPAVAVPDDCPNAPSIPRNASGTAIRQVQIRFASVVAGDGSANVQLSFVAHSPRGSTSVTVAGKPLKCPVDNPFSQIVRFTMPTGGDSKKVTLTDGTQLTVTASRK
jgi:Family of unknown function (DUF6013)